MSYRVEKGTNDIVIQGFEQGIANDPYEGISDCRNINLISIPKEASVNFSTSQISQVPLTGTVTNASSNVATYTVSGGLLDNNVAIQFSSQSGLGVTVGQTYYIGAISGGGGGTFQLYSDYAGTSLVTLTNGGTGVWATVNMTLPKYFAFDGVYYWLVDSSGQVWSNKNTTPNTGNKWTFTGNKPNNSSNGNGLIYYAGYIFVFSNQSIDYTPTGTVSWVYQWSPSTATVNNSGLWSATPTILSYMNSVPIHQGIIAPDNKVYFCDGSYIDRFFQQAGQTFAPQTATSYVWDQTKVLPLNDIAQCIAPLGNNLLIGGILNVVYPWDTFSQTALYPILLAEYNVQQLVTVNTNCFIFVGNRGRVWITNGSQAQLFVKIPDHLSGTVEPYYTWGGAFSNKNQIYFSALVTTNGGVANNNYGGVWAINLSSGLTGIDIGNCLRLVNQLSYGTYAGYASAMISQFSGNPAGTGYFAGWYDGVSGYGIDTTSSTPYTGRQAYIDSDLIPMGTFLRPVSNGRVEFKLAVPIVNGESIKLQYRQRFSDSFADLSSTVLFNYSTSTNGGGNGWNGYSGGYQSVNFQNSQWVQIRAVLTSTGSSPSYVRLTELRKFTLG